MVACANNVGFGGRHTKLVLSHSGSGVRFRAFRLTYALLSLLSRVLTNGSNKAFALAHTASGFISASAFVLPPTVSPIAEEEESAAAKDVLDEKEEEEEAAPELLAEARVEDEAQAAEEDDDDDDDDDDDGLRSAS